MLKQIFNGVQTMSYLEKLYYKFKSYVARNKYPLLVGIIVGLLAYVYMFTNKLLSADEISSIFTKGATVSFGRWGMEIMKLIFPNYSMPWIYGIISIVLLTIVGIEVADFLEIKNELLVIFTVAITVCSPAVISGFAFMFCASSYALSLLLATLSVKWILKKNTKYKIISVVMMALSISIYQAYIQFIAALVIVKLIKKLLIDDYKPIDVFKEAVWYFAFLIISLILYYAIQLAFEALGTYGERMSYAFSGKSILERIVVIYTSFAGIFYKGYYGYVRGTISTVIHMMILIVEVSLSLYFLVKKKKIGVVILTALLAIMYPAATNSLHLIADTGVIHSVSQFSFVTFYYLAIVLCDGIEKKNLYIFKDVIEAALVFVLVSNIFLANETYFSMQLNYENAYSYFTTMLAEIHSTPGYTEDLIVVFIGSEDENNNLEFKHLNNLFGVNDSIINAYTREAFLKYFIGSNVVTTGETWWISDTGVEDMPCYPDNGSIKLASDGNSILVKMS